MREVAAKMLQRSVRVPISIPTYTWFSPCGHSTTVSVHADQLFELKAEALADGDQNSPKEGPADPFMEGGCFLPCHSLPSSVLVICWLFALASFLPLSASHEGDSGKCRLEEKLATHPHPLCCCCCPNGCMLEKSPHNRASSCSQTASPVVPLNQCS